MTRTRKDSLVRLYKHHKILQEALVKITTRTGKNSLIRFLQDSLKILQEPLVKITTTSMYPPHSGAIGPIKLLTGVSNNLEHFLISLMGISSATLSLSLPLFLKKMILITLSMAQQCLLT